VWFIRLTGLPRPKAPHEQGCPSVRVVLGQERHTLEAKGAVQVACAGAFRVDVQHDLIHTHSASSGLLELGDTAGEERGAHAASLESGAYAKLGNEPGRGRTRYEAEPHDVHPNLGDQKTARAQCRLLLQEHGAKLLAWWEGFTFQLEDFIELRLPERVEL
jgi:hypothetical protein